MINDIDLIIDVYGEPFYMLQHHSKSEEKHGRLLKRGSGDCRTFPCSVTYDLSSEERQSILQDLSLQSAIKTLLKRGRGDYRTLLCSVSEQLKTLEERHGRPELFPVCLDI